VKLVPYKRRKLSPAVPTWVYRNLHHRRDRAPREDGPWYSIVQNGLVIGHAREVALVDVHFVVRASGRAKVVETGVKNVHAFVVGTLATPESLTWAAYGERVSARYNPLRSAYFEFVDPDGGWFELRTAGPRSSTRVVSTCKAAGANPSVPDAIEREDLE
jgi:hypothetical protein